MVNLLPKEVCYEYAGQTFIWDLDKAQLNIKNHGVTFEEAATVFADDNIAIYYDENHSDAEDRFLAVGYSMKSKLLVVCHCVRENDVIRIITAREADNNIRRQYENQ